jgi:hypothetical protein
MAAAAAATATHTQNANMRSFRTISSILSGLSAAAAPAPARQNQLNVGGTDLTDAASAEGAPRVDVQAQYAAAATAAQNAAYARNQFESNRQSATK